MKINCFKYCCGFLALALLFCCKRVEAADNNTPLWRIGLFIAPERSFQYIRSDNSFGNEIIIPFQREFDVPSLAFNAGVRLAYQLSPKWQIRTGITLNERSQYTRQIPRCWPSPDNCRAFTTARYASTVKSIFHTYFGYITLPIGIQYRIWQVKNWDVDVFAAPSFDYLAYIRDNVYEYDSAGNEQAFTQNKTPIIKDRLNRFSASGTLGLFLGKDIGQKLKIEIEPYYRVSSPLAQKKRSVVVQNFYAFGLGFSLGYKL